MTLQEWTARTVAELAAAGFTVTTFEGFPLVTCPDDVAGITALLEFRTTLPADRAIYAEGMLYSPAGARRVAEQLEAAPPAPRPPGR